MIKHIEIWLRTLIRAVLVGWRKPQYVDVPAQSGQYLTQAQSILLLRQDRIGDVLISTPLVKALRDQFPQARIDILLGSNNEGVKQAVAPMVNQVLVYRKSASSLISVLAAIRKVRYDVIVDLMDNPSTTSSIIVRWSKATARLGVDKTNAAVYTHVVPMLDRSSTPIARRIAQLLMPFGIDPEGVSLKPIYSMADAELDAARVRLGMNQSATSFHLGVVASGSGSGRSYPPEATARILNTLTEQYPAVKVHLFSDGKHRQWTQTVSELTSAIPVQPSADFHSAVVAMSCMQALWTPDTSIVHVAAARSTPVCVMYVHSNPALLPWYPIGAHYEALTTSTNDIANIPEADILAAMQRLFAYCNIHTGES
ncbi:MAG: glycosyltransferase family 9 protein [Bradyrhizobiaceae bacterium]|nr:glycosyltransferase family 9 protein [Bradyrhizobiaceae bacterium]